MAPHIFLATPAYSGTVHVPYAISLSDTKLFLASQGVKLTVNIGTSGSLLVAERNRLLELFWMSDATHILCVDADLGWPPEAILGMLNSGKEFVAGIYPARNTKGFIFRPKINEDGSLIQENHLLAAEYVPAGFMLISREAVAKMRDAYPELYYAPKDPRADSESTYCLFNTEVMDGEFWGEDYVFCRRAREAGIDIWIDPLIQFNHAGTIGTLTEVLVTEKPTN